MLKLYFMHDHERARANLITALGGVWTFLLCLYFGMWLTRADMSAILNPLPQGVIFLFSLFTSFLYSFIKEVYYVHYAPPADTRTGSPAPERSGALREGAKAHVGARSPNIRPIQRNYDSWAVGKAGRKSAPRTSKTTDV